jgi:preprotein translocase subunit YajC
MTFITGSILAQAPPAGPTGPASLLGRPEIMLVIMVVMFYFLLIRPQQRQKKELAARIAKLQSGDKVITTSGIHGIIHNVKDTTVVIKVAEGTMLEFDKAAVAIVRSKETAVAK